MSMFEEDVELVRSFSETRNLQKSTEYGYRIYIKEYSKFNKLSMCKLLEEAEQEEEAGIRWKKRTLKKRLLEYRSYLYKKHAYATAKTRFSKLMAFYKHFEIEIHPLPPLSTKNKNQIPKTFDDLPTIDQLKEALKISKPLMSSIILFMSSSGCARRETLNLSINDFLKATQDYHNQDNIYDALGILKERNDVIPTFFIRRQKTDKYYYTFCSPEATTSIVHYLLSVNFELKLEKPLFKINDREFLKKFADINDKLGLGFKGKRRRFHSHILRSWNASMLSNDGMSENDVDAIQGRGKDPTHQAYFINDPKKLKEIYISHLNSITINLDVNNIDFKSPEYIELENKYKEKSKEVDIINQKIKKLENNFVEEFQSLKEKIKQNQI